jgi:hypothetical protein
MTMMTVMTMMMMMTMATDASAGGGAGHAARDDDRPIARLSITMMMMSIMMMMTMMMMMMMTMMMMMMTATDASAGGGAGHAARDDDRPVARLLKGPLLRGPSAIRPQPLYAAPSQMSHDFSGQPSAVFVYKTKSSMREHSRHTMIDQSPDPSRDYLSLCM